MNSYVARFAIANVVLIVIAGIVAELLNLKSVSGLGIGAAMASCIFAAAAFAKDHAREPTSEEKGIFAWRALLVSWLTSLILLVVTVAVFLSAGEIREILRSLRSGNVLAIGAGVLLLVSAIYYVSIRWAFGWYAKVAAKQRG